MVHLKKGHFIFSGEINSGKSTRLSQFVAQLKKDGVVIAGILSMPRFVENEKSGFEFHLINNSNTCAVIEFAGVIKKDGWHKFGRWYFNVDAFSQANSFKFDTADLFVVDEIGPLELEQRGGLCPVTEVVYKKYPTTITVVRKTMVEGFQKMLFAQTGSYAIELGSCLSNVLISPDR